MFSCKVSNLGILCVSKDFWKLQRNVFNNSFCLTRQGFSFAFFMLNVGTNSPSYKDVGKWKRLLFECVLLHEGQHPKHGDLSEISNHFFQSQEAAALLECWHDPIQKNLEESGNLITLSPAVPADKKKTQVCFVLIETSCGCKVNERHCCLRRKYIQNI